MKSDTTPSAAAVRAAEAICAIDGGMHGEEQRVAALIDLEIRPLLEALEPLSRVAEIVGDASKAYRDETAIWCRTSTMGTQDEHAVTIGDCRIARAALRRATERAGT